MIKHYPEIISVEKYSAKEVTLKFMVLPEYEGFQGHFVEQPIFPGVGQIDLVIKSSCEQFQLDPYQFCDIPQIKFMKIILPNDCLALNLIQENNAISFKFYIKEQIVSQGKIKYV
ncbi:ApeI family dehydratase [Francisella frigiditurris]|uniref:ApeI dehydratase-like domain-containing protein n=1 Tax=Francisella frigiditurris TaxID=1542390 RepID=A0A1J0KVY2_9GAMM|nr:hydroxymyristoyl-ACP dehydratase [Francisella frigiditurris]APC97780.1 hypothetical protein KX01_1348 [Francisella frigiditurris]